MTSPNDLMSEFQKLKAETDKMYENFINTTSTFGCSSESSLLKKVLDELKSMNSRIGEIEDRQKNQYDVLQKTVLDELNVVRTEVVEIKKKQDALQKMIPDEPKAAKKEIINNVPKVNPDNEKPILEAIVGTWKLVNHRNCKALLSTRNHLEDACFYDDLKVSVYGDKVLIRYLQKGLNISFTIGRWNPWEKVFVEDNHLKRLRLHSATKEPLEKIDHFIKNGQLHIRDMNMGKAVECVRIYERLS